MFYAFCLISLVRNPWILAAIGVFTVLWTGAVSYGRMYSGAHHLADVLGGAVSGLLIMILYVCLIQPYVFPALRKISLKLQLAVAAVCFVVAIGLLIAAGLVAVHKGTFMKKSSTGLVGQQWDIAGWELE